MKTKLDLYTYYIRDGERAGGGAVLNVCVCVVSAVVADVAAAASSSLISKSYNWTTKVILKIEHFPLSFFSRGSFDCAQCVYILYTCIQGLYVYGLNIYYKVFNLNVCIISCYASLKAIIVYDRIYKCYANVYDVYKFTYVCVFLHFYEGISALTALMRNMCKPFCQCQPYSARRK